MRAIALLLLPPLAALACVYALGIATDAPKPATPGSTPTFVWKKQVFKNKRDFSAWLERRNVTYADWRARHPGATLPWEDDGIGGEAVAFLAAALAGLLIVLIRMRRTISRFVVEGPFGRVIERVHADVALPRVSPMGRLSLNDAVAVFGAAAPPEAPQSGPRRPELVLVEARPEAPPAVVLDEPEPLAVAAGDVAAAPPPETQSYETPVAADPEPEVPPEDESASALQSPFDPDRCPPPAYEVRGGICVNCRAQIPPERLEAVPWATQCIECKRKEERG